MVFNKFQLACSLQTVGTFGMPRNMSFSICVDMYPEYHPQKHLQTMQKSCWNQEILTIDPLKKRQTNTEVCTGTISRRSCSIIETPQNLTWCFHPWEIWPKKLATKVHVLLQPRHQWYGPDPQKKHPSSVWRRGCSFKQGLKFMPWLICLARFIEVWSLEFSVG